MIRAEDFATFTSLLDIAEKLEGEQRRIVEAAQAQADVLLAASREEASRLIAEAAQERQQAQREGFDEGLARGLADWMLRAAEAARNRKDDLLRQTKCLSDIVTTAVTRIVEHEDRSAVYRRAVRTVSRALKNVSFLTLRVPAGELGRAKAAVDAVLAGLDPAPAIEIVADTSLAEGDCLFESELGVIDVGLPTQLAAIRRAVERAAELTVASAVEARGSPGGTEVRLPTPEPEASVAQ